MVAPASRGSALLVQRANANFPPSALDASRVRVQRDLQNAASLIAEQIESFLDIVEREPMRHERRQVLAAIFDHRHQAAHRSFHRALPAEKLDVV
jgi:hypothetical protein